MASLWRLQNSVPIKIIWSSCESATGATMLKHRHLRQLGYALVVVPYWEWDQVRGDEAAEVEYLRGKLDSGVVGELAV